MTFIPESESPSVVKITFFIEKGDHLKGMAVESFYVRSWCGGLLLYVIAIN